MTLPARPYWLSLAMRTASSSSSNGMTTRTGPKISSRRDRHRVVDVGEQRGLDEPALVEVRRAAAADHEARALRDALLDVAEHAGALLLADLRALDVAGVGRVAVGDVAEPPRPRSRCPRRSATAAASGAVGIAQPWPPCMHTKAAAGSRAAKSTSSRMMSADLPPSSRNSRFSVAAPFSMMRRPVAVEPVNEMRSTRGSSTSSSPTR